MKPRGSFSVMPAKAGIQGEWRKRGPWIPAFAGMTKEKRDAEDQDVMAPATGKGEVGHGRGK